MPQRLVPMPPPDAKAYKCSCGRYTGSIFGITTHRSKAKAKGATEADHQILIVLEEEDLPGAEPDGAEAAAGEPEPAPGGSDLVLVDGKVEPGTVVEPKGAVPTAFRQQVKTTAELRAYYDYFHVALKYGAGYDQWLEEMTRLAVTELFGFELVMQVRGQRPALAAAGA